MEDKLSNYGKLHDAVILEVHYTYPSYDEAGSHKKVKVIIDCMTISQNWERIALEFEEVSTFFFQEDKSTNQIIDEIKIEPLSSGLYLVDFAQGEYIEKKYISNFYFIFSNMFVSTIAHL